MPQWRKFYVKTVDSLDINDMPDDFTRLLWILLPLGLDCEGRGIDNPAWVKAKIMPLREDVTTKQVKAAMDWLVGRGMIRRYELGTRPYFYIPTWHTYQGDTKREAPSVIPAPPDLLTTNSGVTQELVTTNSCSDVDSDSDSDTDTEKKQIPANAVADATPATEHLPPEKPPRKRKPSKPLTESQQMFTALAAICAIGLKTLTEGQRGQLNQSEKILRDAGATPEQMPAFRAWWDKEDWRGKRGDVPEPYQVREEWGRFVEFTNRPPTRSPASIAVRVYT